MSFKEIAQAYFSSKQAADYMGIPENTLRISRVTGLLYGIKAPSFHKTHKRVFYTKKSLDDWVNQLPLLNNTSENL